jgi:hypothetical protein
MDFLNHGEGGIVFYQVFLLSPLQHTVITVEICKKFYELEEIRKRLREFDKIEIQGKAVEVTVNSKEENSSNFVWISSKNLASDHRE